MSNKLVGSSFSGVDIHTAATALYTYTATKTGDLRFEVFLDAVVGNGNYTIYLTKQLLGSGNAYPFEPKTVPAIASGETFFAAASLNIDGENTDVFKIMALGLAGDTSIGGKVQVWEDDYLRPVTAAQYATVVDASGRVDLGKWLGTAVTLSSGVPDVNIKTITAGIIAAASFAANALDAVWSTATSALTAAGSIGKLLVDNINATIGSRSTYAGADTPGTGTLLARILGTLAAGTHNPQSGDGYPILNNGTYGNSALLTAINNLNNLSALANLFGPNTLVRPSAGSIAYPFFFVVKDTEGHPIDVDTNAVTLTAKNAAGTDRSTNLSAVTHSGTGEYTFNYTVASSAVDEGVLFTAAGTVLSVSRKGYAAADIADSDSLSALAAIQAQTDKLTFNGANVLADLKQWMDATPDALSSGKVPADLKLWLAVAPLALSSQMVQAIVNAYASGQVPLQPTVAGRQILVDTGGDVTFNNTTIPTATNLTNAPTNGDFTAAMKGSLNSATPSVTLAASQPNYAPAKQSDILSDATPFAGAQVAEINAGTDEILTNVSAIPTTPVLTAHFDTIIGTPAVSVSADIAEVEGETDAIKAQTDQLTFNGVQIAADVQSWRGLVPANLILAGFVQTALDHADFFNSLLEAGLILIRGTVVGTSTTSTFNTDLAVTGDHQLDGALVVFLGDANTDLYKRAPHTIAHNIGSVITLDVPFQAAPVAGNTFVLLPSTGIAPSVSQIVDGVWNEQIANHETAGSTGEALFNASAGAGTGFYTVEIPCEVSGLPASGVQVRVTTDVDGISIVAQALSNTSGTAVVYLDTGSYFVFLARGGDVFPNPTIINVP